MGSASSGARAMHTLPRTSTFIILEQVQKKEKQVSREKVPSYLLNIILINFGEFFTLKSQPFYHHILICPQLYTLFCLRFFGICPRFGVQSGAVKFTVSIFIGSICLWLWPWPNCRIGLIIVWPIPTAVGPDEQIASHTANWQPNYEWSPNFE